MTEDETGVDAAIEGELLLLDHEVRRSPQRVAALLHPEFHEFGASGRVWDRATTLTLLEEDPADAPPTKVSGMKAVRLAPDVVHLTYDTDADGRRAHRSSLWRRTDDGWRLWFHQGTLFPSGTH
ncbi:nuclear transport factor 2 family protein [Streptomyces sp. NPDC052012]|uniref:nuclear transport factor 2 family protein n=1 Tax=Streptomyces sp. NPDC052012 TaxID=3155051 RepID=UPI00344DA7D5